MGRDDFRPWVGAIQARALADRQEVERAEALFEQSIQEASSTHVGFVVMQYQVCFGEEKALQKLPEWVNQRPDDPAIHAVAATMFRGAGELDRALPFAEEAARLAEGDDVMKLTAHVELGQIRYDQGDFLAAETSWLTVLEIDPDNPYALNNLAYMYVADLSTAAKALALAKRAAQRLPTNPSVLDTYGWALAQTGDHAEAVNYLQRAVGLAPSPASHYHLGWAEEQRGYRDQARRQYEMALQLMDEQEDLDLELKQLITEALQRVQE